MQEGNKYNRIDNACFTDSLSFKDVMHNNTMFILVILLFSQLTCASPWNKYFYKSSIAVHWGVSVLPFWWAAYKNNNIISLEEVNKIQKACNKTERILLDSLHALTRTENENLVNALEDKIPLYEAIREEFNKQASCQKTTLHIVPKVEKQEWAASSSYTYENNAFVKHGIIYVPLKEVSEEADEFTRFMGALDYEQLDKGSVQHEIAHIVNNDTLKDHLALLLLPLGIHGAGRLLKPIFLHTRSIIYKKKMFSANLKNGITQIFGGLGKAALTGIMYLGYRKSLEYKADDAIELSCLPYEIMMYEYDIKSLEEARKRAKHDRVMRVALYVKAFNEKICPFPLNMVVKKYEEPIAVGIQKLDEALPSLVEEVFLDPHHPRRESRLKRFERRIK